jgi:cysteine-rich repeat protein
MCKFAIIISILLILTQIFCAVISNPDSKSKPSDIDNQSICGNGTIETNETCDDGNLTDGDGCDQFCKLEISPFCGDGTIDTDEGEECDDANNNSNSLPDACRQDCMNPSCGDNVADPANNEECDNGDSNSNSIPNACRLDCKNPSCGDNVTDPGYNEECDNGDNNSNFIPDACRLDCKNPSCGDNVTDPDNDEECDDGNLINGDGCDQNCLAEPDETPPAIDSTSPYNSENNVSVDIFIFVTFDEIMNPLTITTNTSNTSCSGTIQLSSNGFSTCVRMLSSPSTGNNITFTVKPAVSLDISTTYTLKIIATVTDTAGNPLGTDITISFTTGSGLHPYYSGVNTSLSDDAFKLELHNLVDGHTNIGYSAIWGAFYDTDLNILGCTGSDVGDVYSSYCWTYSSDQCGNYDSEGDCYNREHSWPKSWFNDVNPPTADLFHIYPTDGWVNGVRSAYPYGEVGSANYTSTNGSKRGNCVTPGYSGTVFEPIDSLKGDFARTYFYMSVRYYTEDGSWDTTAATDKANILTWQENMLRAWHTSDPVSAKEMDRNDAIQTYQGNRNPFIDNPSWVDKISDF